MLRRRVRARAVETATMILRQGGRKKRLATKSAFAETASGMIGFKNEVGTGIVIGIHGIGIMIAIPEIGKDIAIPVTQIATTHIHALIAWLITMVIDTVECGNIPRAAVGRSYQRSPSLSGGRLLRRRDPLGRQAPKHRIDTLRRQLRPAVKPPGHHGHESTNDILDDKFARDDVRGILAAGRGKFIPHQVRKYLANFAEADGAAVAADER